MGLTKWNGVRDCLRYAGVMLGYKLDDVSEKSGVGRYVIARQDSSESKRINERSARRLQKMLFV
ncbi:Hypothetical protein NGAL_HAMBI490_54610 [Neorhizobium galegae bv. officinalis]|nr:Hypothetical protein NGAL_HAMBI490_54610 [Neorhizobium galegae bv. officinalis]